ncbi:MAG: hypothetical protein JSV94_03380 [Methanobacteriota archaeon]|nr:MAG: hypothetical protein JSV94_03380 [Euryarchaeota archaeon]
MIDLAFSLQAQLSPNARKSVEDHTAPSAATKTDSDIIAGNLLDPSIDVANA